MLENSLVEIKIVGLEATMSYVEVSVLAETSLVLVFEKGLEAALFLVAAVVFETVDSVALHDWHLRRCAVHLDEDSVGPLAQYDLHICKLAQPTTLFLW